MNTRQEIVDVFDGRPSSDCPPPAVFTQTGTVDQMRSCGAGWPEANFDIDRMVGLSLQFSRSFGFATARVPYCLTVEAERLGGHVYEGREDSQPSIRGSPFRTDDMCLPPVPDDLMDPDEFVAGGRCTMVAEAASRMASRGDLFVTAGMIDPAGIAGQLLGAENLIVGYMLDPDTAIGWCRAMTPYSCAYASLLSENADNVTVIGSASMDIFTPEMYADLTEPYLKRQLSSISCFSTMHSCGRTVDVIDSLVSLGADGLSLEASEDPRGFLDRVDGRCLMFGAVNPVHTLLMGTPADVVAEARRDAEAGFDIITPECGIPPRTPDANLGALAGYRGKTNRRNPKKRDEWALPDLNRRPSGYEPDALPG